MPRGSLYLNSAIQYENTELKILIYGDEAARVHVRLISSLATDGQNDMDFEDESDDLIGHYSTEADRWKPGWASLNKKKRRQVEDAYRAGLNYLDIGMENRWKGLINAVHSVTRWRSVIRNICNPYDLSPLARNARTLAPPDTDDCYQEVEESYTAYEFSSSDGLVKRGTAKGEILRSAEDAFCIIMGDSFYNKGTLGSGHQQLTRDRKESYLNRFRSDSYIP